MVPLQSGGKYNYVNLFGRASNRGYVYIKGIDAGRDTATFEAFNEGIRDTRKIKATIEYTPEDGPKVENFDIVQYIVADTNSFVHELVFNTSLRSAFAAQAAYSEKDLIKYGLHLENTLAIKDLFDLSNQINADALIEKIEELKNLKWANQTYQLITCVYQDYAYEAKDVSNIHATYPDIKQAQFLFAFQGTDPSAISHWLVNFYQAGGAIPDPYRLAVDIGKDLFASKKSFRFVGHSLGGGLAAAASVSSDCIPAITFNAAGLNGNLIPNNLEAYEKAYSRVYAYNVNYDLLTIVQESTRNPANGELVFPTAFGRRMPPLLNIYKPIISSPEGLYTNEELPNDIARYIATEYDRLIEAIKALFKGTSRVEKSTFTILMNCHKSDQIIFGLLFDALKSDAFYGYSVEETVVKGVVK